MQNGVKEAAGAGRQPDGLLVLRTLAMPRDSNANWDIFGGWILSQMDIGGGLLAKEVSHSRVVTVTIDKMTFVTPVHVGDAICVYAKVMRIGNTSMYIRLEVWAKDLTEEDRARLNGGVERIIEKGELTTSEVLGHVRNLVGRTAENRESVDSASPGSG